MNRRLALALAWTLACAVPGTARAVERFALVVGNDVGDASRPKLWFAQRDAERFAHVLTDLGGVPEANVTLLRGTGLAQVLAAIEELETRVATARAAGERTLLVFYFSGHANPSSLELRGDRLGFDQVRSLILGSSADVKVAIVDACSAGSLTQVKGGRADPAVDFALPGEENVEGVAFLASTAQGEAAQESAALGGSFFSHHLEVALRGAADADGDGQVTLGEAFRFSSARTLSGTASTQAGPQHPTYAMHMSGRGDIVLADLRRAEARLRLPADPGALYLLSGPKALVAEVPGPAAPISLALPAGTYEVERRSKGRREVGQVALAKGQDLPLPQLAVAPFGRAQAKGSDLRLNELALGFSAQTIPLKHGDAALGIEGAYRRALGPVALRLRADLGWRDVVDESVRYKYGSYSLSLALLWPFFDRKVRLEIGLEGSAALVTQDFDTHQHPSAVQGGAGGLVLASMPVGPVRLGLELSFAERWFHLNSALVYKGLGQAALLVGWEL